jgi:16S rRNA (adenine1518-N6/adenine1519-N6)-dimethyltransferase
MADALETDASGLGAPPRRIVANLPYNVATPLLLKWLSAIDAFASLTLMFQKEVADRLTARPRTKDYGRLSVLTQWLSEPRRLFDIPARAFTPPPKVTSSVVQLTPRPAPLHPADRTRLERVTAAAFGQRRKMLRQSLKSLTADPPALLARAGVPETARAEELDIAQFCALARILTPSASIQTADPIPT